MALSRFTPCGILRCSSRKPVTRVLYDNLKESSGPAFVGPYSDADAYAMAMCLGSAQAELDRASGQRVPSMCSEFISGLEDQYELVPSSDSSLNDRRNALAAAMLLRNGARIDAIEDGLRGILGSGFVAYIVARNVSPLDRNSGAFKPPNTPISVIQTGDVIMPGAVTVSFAHCAGDKEVLKAGDVLVFEPNINGIAEPVQLTSATGDGSAGTLTATFAKPHSSGCLATTAPWPLWISYQRHVNIIVTSAVINSAPLMRKIRRFMAKWSRVVTTWDTVPENSHGAHQAGPFYPNSGLPNITPIGAITY